jgi:hypothetical protein
MHSARASSLVISSQTPVFFEFSATRLKHVSLQRLSLSTPHKLVSFRAAAASVTHWFLCMVLEMPAQRTVVVVVSDPSPPIQPAVNKAAAKTNANKILILWENYSRYPYKNQPFAFLGFGLSTPQVESDESNQRHLEPTHACGVEYRGHAFPTTPHLPSLFILRSLFKSSIMLRLLSPM